MTNSIWDNPDAEIIFQCLNRNRKMFGMPPLTREKAVEPVQERLDEDAKFRRWMDRQKQRGRRAKSTKQTAPINQPNRRT